MALADFIGDVVAHLNTGRDEPIPSYLGEKYKAQNDAPPRLVWVPTSDTFGPAVRIGANPKSVANRVAGVECRIWGATLADTEALLNDVLVAARRMGGGLLEMRGGEWQTEGELANEGFLYVMSLAVQIPVTEPAAVAITPETYTTSTRVVPLGPL